MVTNRDNSYLRAHIEAETEGQIFRRDQLPGERVAEFLDAEDAMLFMRLKGADQYTVCAGIRLPWAVRQRVTP